MKRLFYLLLFLLGVSLLVIASPIFIGEKITKLFASYIPTPPPPPIRTMAEWEEVQAVVISWYDPYKSVQKEIIRHAQEECKVIVLTYDTNLVINYLEASDVPIFNLQLVLAQYNSAWIRDYGPWTVYHNDVDSLILVDWIYDRMDRYYDDISPALVANILQIPHHEAIEAPHDWRHEGGNTLRDGLGTFFSSSLVFETNPDKTESEIDTIAKLFLGAERYFKLQALPYDTIHHLDMHSCFLDEETILVGEYPEGVADGPQIEENLAILSQIPTAFGNEYNIIRIPMPPDALGRYPDSVDYYRTHTNSIFINKTILVPIYEEQYDTTALRIYEESLPGYNVVGIDCDIMADEYGAIHCITKLIGVNDPLWIAHGRLKNQTYSTAGYLVEAKIKHQSGIAGATLHYRLQGTSEYEPITMSLQEETEALWAATLPSFEEGVVINYYIEAIAESGKIQRRPMPAPEGYFSFKIRVTNAVDVPVETNPLLQIYPNPAATFFNVKFNMAKKGEVRLVFRTTTGQIVKEIEQYFNPGIYEIKIEVGEWSSGQYILTMYTENQKWSKPIVVI